MESKNSYPIWWDNNRNNESLKQSFNQNNIKQIFKKLSTRPPPPNLHPNECELILDSNGEEVKPPPSLPNLHPNECELIIKSKLFLLPKEPEYLPPPPPPSLPNLHPNDSKLIIKSKLFLLPKEPEYLSSNPIENKYSVKDVNNLPDVCYWCRKKGPLISYCLDIPVSSPIHKKYALGHENCSLYI